MNKIRNMVHRLVNSPVIDETDVHHLVQHSTEHDSRNAMAEIIYKRHFAYCVTVGGRLDYKLPEVEEHFSAFVCKALHKKPLEDLIKMAISAAYTGTCFRHFLIDEHRKKKINVVEDETHLAHRPSTDQPDFNSDEVLRRCEAIIRHQFEHGERNIEVFHLHLKGYSDQEINEKLGIKSAHTIKNRIKNVLRGHNL